MRVKVINSRADLEALGSAAGQEQAPKHIEQIQQLNPHLDVKNIKKGTVVLVPTRRENVTPKLDPFRATRLRTCAAR